MPGTVQSARFGRGQFLRKQGILPTLTPYSFFISSAISQQKLFALHLSLADGVPAVSEVQFMGVFNAILSKYF